MLVSCAIIGEFSLRYIRLCIRKQYSIVAVEWQFSGTLSIELHSNKKPCTQFRGAKLGAWLFIAVLLQSLSAETFSEIAKERYFGLFATIGLHHQVEPTQDDDETHGEKEKAEQWAE